jgi:membrane protein DedA with SNARE-associated domain
MITAMAGAAPVPHALTALPAAVAVLCALVIAEITAVPGILLPGGTMTLLAGALIGAGRSALAVAVPVAAAVIIGDQLAYLTGAAVIGWWRRRRPGRAGSRLARQGRAARWLTAAMPSLAGAVRLPYAAFVPRLLAMRLPWLAGMLAAGALAARSLAVIGRVAGIAGLAASAVVAAVLLAVHGRLPIRVIAREPRVRLGGLLLTGGLAAVACGAQLQDTAAGEETARLNPRVAELVASHVPPGAAYNAVGLSHLVRSPGLWFMAVMAVAFLDVKRRGRSTVRIAAATGGSPAIAAILDVTLPGWDRHPAVSPGAAAVAALAITTVLFAGRWLNPIRAGIAAAATGTAAAGRRVIDDGAGVQGQHLAALH